MSADGPASDSPPVLWPVGIAGEPWDT